MAKVSIPTPLRQFTEQKDTVEYAGATVGEVLNGLTGQFGGLRQHLFNDEGKLRNFVNIYLNDEDIRYTGGPATALKAGDVLDILPALAGGAR